MRRQQYSSPDHILVSMPSTMFRKMHVIVFFSVLCGLSINVMASQSFDQSSHRSPLAGREYAEGRVIVKYAPGLSEKDKAGVRAYMGATLGKELRLIGAEMLYIGEREVNNLINQFRSDSRLTYIEPDFVQRADLVPNDPRFSEQWALRSSYWSSHYVSPDINADAAWNIGCTSSVVIGLIDSGVDTSHVDLRDNLWNNRQEIPENGIDDDLNGYTDDIHGWDFVNNDADPVDDFGHGTHVAGIIGAVGNNATGITGVCWSSRIMILKFLDSEGYGTATDAILSIEYAIRNGARVTNNSWGGPLNSQPLREAIDSARAYGRLFVAAAGNTGVDIDLHPTFPCGFDLPNIISVAATNRSNELASFSNWGRVGVDLAAPGEYILSTFPGDRYGYASGTSMAAPFVTGVIGLMWSKFPNLTFEQVKSKLLSNVDTLEYFDWVCVSEGRLNAFKCLVEPDSIPPAPIADLVIAKTEGTRVHLSWTATGDDLLSGNASGYDIRYSPFPLNMENFQEADSIIFTSRPQLSGQPESLVIEGLDYSTTYYIALKVLDEWEAVSSISNIVSTQTLGPPDIAITPISLSDSLSSAEVVDREISVSNLGEGELFYTTDIVYTNPKAVGSINVEFPASDTSEGSNRIRNQSQERTIFQYDISGEELAGVPSRVLLLYADFGCSTVKGFLDAYPDIDTLGTWYAGDLSYGGSIPTLDVLTEYDVVVAWSNEYWTGFDTIGDVLADYIDVGGAVITASECWASSWRESYGRYFEESGYSPFSTQGTLIGEGSSIDWFDAEHPLMDNFDGLTVFDSYNNVKLTEGAVAIARFSDGTPAVAINPHTVAINVWPGDYNLWAGSLPTLIHNSINYLNRRNRWLTVSPRTGELLGSHDLIQRVEYRSAGLIAGEHSANIIISSSDPDEPITSIPVRIDVAGTPRIATSPTLLDFGKSFIGYVDTLTMRIDNLGTDTLKVWNVTTTNTEFVTSGIDGVLIPPKSHTSIEVTFAPLSSGESKGQLTIESNDSNSPVLMVTMIGNGVEAPRIAAIDNPISASIFEGGRDSVAFFIRNDGLGSLHYQLEQRLHALSKVMELCLDSQLTIQYQSDSELAQIGVFTGGMHPILQDYLYYELAADPELSTQYHFEILSNYSEYDSIKRFDGIILAEDDSAIAEQEVGALEEFASRGNSIVLGMNNLDDEPSQLRSRLMSLFGISGVADGYYFFDELNNQNPITQSLNYVRSFPFPPHGRFELDKADWLFSGVDSGYYGVSMVANYKAVLVGENYTIVDGVNNRSLTRNIVNWAVDKPLWLRVSNLTGDIEPGGVDTLWTYFRAGRTGIGYHSAQLTIRSRDLPEQSVNMLVELNVIPSPDIEADSCCIDFGTVFVSGSKVNSVRVFNKGSLPLNIQELELIESGFNSVNFRAEISSLIVSPDSFATIRIICEPKSFGNHQASLRLKTDDPDEPFVKISLAARAAEPPAVQIDPTFLVDTTCAGQQHSETLELRNIGRSDLKYSIEYSQDSQDKSATTVVGERLSFTALPSTPKVGVAGTGGSPLIPYLLNDSILVAHYVFAEVPDNYSLDQLEDYDAIIVDENAADISEDEAIALAQYSDLGYSILLGMDDMDYEPESVRNRLFPVFGVSTVREGYFPGGVPNPLSPIPTNLTWIEGFGAGYNDCYFVNDGIGLIGTGQGSYFAISNSRPSRSVLFGEQIGALVYNTTNRQLITDVISWIAPSCAWLKVDKLFGTIAPGESRKLEVLFDATDLGPGLYSQELLVNTNIPLQASMSIPVSLLVFGSDFSCGDCNGNNIVNISDVVHLVNYIFAGGPAPQPPRAGDANCDSFIGISDAVYLINYIFAGGAAPCAACP